MTKINRTEIKVYAVRNHLKNEDMAKMLGLTVQGYHQKMYETDDKRRTRFTEREICLLYGLIGDALFFEDSVA